VKTVSVAEAKAKLPSLLQSAAAGEKVVITRHGKAIAELRAIEPTIDARDPHGLKWLAEQRKQFTPMRQSAVDLIREMREADDH
jgi:prevent-host-death family protein